MLQESLFTYEIVKVENKKVIYAPEVTIRLVRERTSTAEMKVVRTPQDAYDVIVEEFEDLPVEHFKIILLNTKNKVLGISTISTGTLDASIVSPRSIFQRAILMNAASIICCHNHPSGDPSPSPEDIALTRKLIEAGKIMGIHVLDHVVVGEYKYYSLKEKGII